MKKLPVFKLILSDDIDNSTGLSSIALVESPAIEEDFIAFSKDGQQTIKFSIQEDRQIVTGPVLIPDMKVYRTQPMEHFVFIDKEGIELTVKKFFKSNRIGNVNAEHTATLLSGIYPFEVFISDTSRGINPPTAFKNLPDGTAFFSYFIEAPELWEQVKNGTFKGFSIEGLYQLSEVLLSKASLYKEFIDLFEREN